MTSTCKKTDEKNHCYKDDNPNDAIGSKDSKVKRVIRRRGWADGVILPGLAGCLMGYWVIHNETVSVYSRYIFYAFGAWQIICGLGVFYDLAPGYLKSSVPQAGKLAELVGAAWLVLGYLTTMAARELAKANGNSLVDAVLVGCLVFNGWFAINAGPQRLRDANDEEMMLVPITSLLVGCCAGMLGGRSMSS